MALSGTERLLKGAIVVDADGRVVLGNAGSGSILGTVDTELPAAAILADGTSVPSTPLIGVANLLSNGSTLDLQRGTLPLTVLASAARTSTTTSATQTNYNHRTLVVFLSISANPGAGENLTPFFRAIDPVSGNAIEWQMSSAIAGANSTLAWGIGPGVTGGYLNGQSSAVVPRSWAVRVAHSASGSWTYSVGAVLGP